MQKPQLQASYLEVTQSASEATWNEEQDTATRKFCIILQWQWQLSWPDYGYNCMTVGIVQSAHGMILSLKWAVSTPSHVGFKIQRAQRQNSFTLEWIQLKLLKYYLHIIILLLYVMKPTTYAVHTLKILLSQNNVISYQSVNWQCKGAKIG